MTWIPVCGHKGLGGSEGGGSTWSGQHGSEAGTDQFAAAGCQVQSLKKLQRAAKTKTLYQLNDDKEGEHWVIKQVCSTTLVAALQKKHGSNLKEGLNEAIAGL